MVEWNEFADLLGPEIAQRRAEGCDVAAFEERVKGAREKKPDLSIAEQVSILDELEDPAPEASFPYEEPSTLEEIRALRPEGPRRMTLNLTDDQLLDRIYGGWLGRAAGCVLGKPVEAWTKKRIASYLEFAEALPLTDYIPHKEGHPEGLELLQTWGCTRGAITFMPGDDDTNYTVLGLCILETFGADFSSDDVAESWLGRLTYNSVWTAEKMAYHNLVNHLRPPETASFHNPYREFIGAQIRADCWGYAAPGWPEKAAEFAFRDAAVSHVKNGIYGEMFVAAMLAASFATGDVEEAVKIGLSEIPENCRLAEAIRDTLDWCKGSDDWEEVWDRIKDKYGHYGSAHTINNACVVVMSLMMAGGEYERSIVVSVLSGWDTDCNGATAGSISGLMQGAEALPDKWVGVLNDRLLSGVLGYADNRMSDLAKRTLRIAKQVVEENGMQS